MSDCKVCKGLHDPLLHERLINNHRKLLEEYSCQCGGTCALCQEALPPTMYSSRRDPVTRHITKLYKSSK